MERGNVQQPQPVLGKRPDTGYTKHPPVYEIDPDEMIHGYLELNLTAPDSKSVRRYQIIIVQRGQERAEYMADMGIDSLWGIDQICIPGEFIITAAKAMDVANEIRMNKMQEQLSIEPEDLYNGYFDMVDEAIKNASHISQFGPSYKVQRN